MKAVLFDLDRTLVDVQSFTDYTAALADVQSLIGTWDDPPTPPTGWDTPTRQAMGILVAMAGDPRWQRISGAIARHEWAAVPASRPMPRLHRALRLAADRPRAVVTLLPDDVAAAVLEGHGVDISVVVGRRSDLAVKPAPDQLLAACASLDVTPEETVMIGDSTWDAAAAGAAGCAFIGVTNGRPSEFASETDVVATLDEAVALI